MEMTAIQSVEKKQRIGSIGKRTAEQLQPTRKL